MWIFLALASALSLSLADVAAKRALRSADALAVSWLKLAGAAVITLPLLFSAEIPDAWPFTGLVLAAIPLEVLALFGYHRALARSPMSLTLPMLAFTPVFLLFFGWLMLGEKPSPAGYAGVLLVAIGAYLLHVQPGTGLAGPLKAIWREPGPRIMLGVSALYAVTASLGKKLVTLSSANFFAGVYPLLLAVFLLPAMASGERREGVKQVPLAIVLLLGVLYGGMVIFHFAALSRAPAAYMIAVKRTSLLFAVLWGRVFFDEPAAFRKAAAAAVMLGGVACLAY